MDADKQIEIISKIAAGVASNPRTAPGSSQAVAKEAALIFNAVVALVNASKSKASK